MKKNGTLSFWSLAITQATMAFNDNFFKVAVGLVVTNWVQDMALQNTCVSLSGFVYVAPFIAFSLLAGRLTDRVSKNRLIVATKQLEFLVIAVAAGGLLFKNLPLLITGIFLFGLEGAFFGPPKYGILPEMILEKNLPKANGILMVLTVGAVLIGTISATFVSSKPLATVVIMGCVGLAGYAASLLIPRLPPANPRQQIAWNPLPELLANLKLIKARRSLSHAVLAVSYFWFAGALIQLNMIVFGKSVMKASDQMVGLILGLVVIGVVAGSMVAWRLSKDKIELGPVPMGAFGLSAISSHLIFVTGSWWVVCVDVALLGFCAALFLVPLESFIQAKSPPKDRGRIMATVNFLSFISIMLASTALWLLGSVIKADPGRIFLIFGVASFIPALFIALYIPQAWVRTALFVLTKTVYRTRISGGENLPLTGPALIVPNHVSQMDAFLLWGSVSRTIRFLMFKDYFDAPWLKHVAHSMEAIPISEADPPREMMRSLITARKKLQQGHLVGIFMKNALSPRAGELQEFKRGLEILIKDLNAPVIPVYLHGVWGNIFSFIHHKLTWKWPGRFPFAVRVVFGRPLFNPTITQIRQSLMDLEKDLRQDNQQHRS